MDIRESMEGALGTQNECFRTLCKHFEKCILFAFIVIPISQTSRGNAIWFEKLGVQEIEGDIKLRLINPGIV